MKKTTKKLVFISVLVSMTLLIIHFINKLFFYINTFKEHLYSSQSHDYQWRFGKIHYTKEGNGPALLLIHDLDNTSSHYEWKDVAGKLSKNHTVYTIDLIGCGKSDKPKIIYTNYLYVQLLSDFMRDVIGEKTSVVCTRYSCSLSIMACYIDSKLFDNLILINPRDIASINQYPKTKHKAMRFFLNMPIIGTLLYNIKHSRISLYKRFNNDYLYDKKSIYRFVNAYSEAAHTSGANSLYVYSSIRCRYTDTNISHALKDITNRIVILEGGDVKNAQDILNQYEAINPNIESIIMFNTKELPQIDNANQIVSLINSFTE